MSWKSPWSSKTSLGNPVGEKAKALAEEEAALARQMEEITAQLEALKCPVEPVKYTTSLHSGQEAFALESGHPSALKKPIIRTHRAQQKRDRNLFIALALVLVILIIWLIRAL